MPDRDNPNAPSPDHSNAPSPDHSNAKLPDPAAEPGAASVARALILVSGRVQGVYYRSAASEQARVLGLRGIVRNLPSGEVELIAEGPRPVLQQLIDWCHLGPPAARVTQVEVSFADATAEYGDFRVLRSLTGTGPVPTQPPGSGPERAPAAGSLLSTRHQALSAGYSCVRNAWRGGGSDSFAG